MEQKDYRLAAIMYTDIAGFSQMMAKDEAGTLATLSWHNKLIADIAGRHHGTVIKTIGDAVLVDFKNTVEAVASSIEIQDELFKRNLEHRETPLLVRIGIHMGDIYFFENDALGEGINIAARLQALAKPGSICISQDVYNLVLNKIDFSARSLGTVALKNVSKEIGAYEISSPNAGLAAPAAKEPRVAKTPAPEKETGETGSHDLLSRIREAILAEIKSSGKRMSVGEARDKYGYYGVEAAEVIASLAERGILRRDPEPKQGAQSSEQGDPEESTEGVGRRSYTQSDIGRSIESAVHGIVAEIERSIESSVHDHDRGASRERRREFKEEIKRRTRAAMKEGGFHRHRGGDLGDTAAEPSPFELYRDKLIAKAAKVGKGLAGHVTSFLMVNAGLWFLNLGTDKSFLWAAIVSASWGIGLIGNIVNSMRLNSEAREVEVMPELDARTLDDLKRLNKERDSISGHITSTVTVPMLLAVINFLVSPETAWFLIPAGALAFGLVIHIINYLSRVPALKRSIFKAIKAKGGMKSAKQAKEERENLDESLGTYADMYRDAEKARQALEQQCTGMGDIPFDDIRPSLERYMGQVKLLAQSANEIDRLIEAIPMEELKADKARLASKALAAENVALKSEYQSSIAEIERQENSYGELKDQNEVIRLRLGSSINQLKQMRLDMARLKAAGAEESEAGFGQIRTKATELSHYLDDLRTGFSEYSEDPFEELKRLEEQKRLPRSGIADSAPTAAPSAAPAAADGERNPVA